MGREPRVDEFNNTGRKTGFWLEEFAAPYFMFRDAGVDLTLASQKVGQPPIDPKSDLPENQTPAMARFKTDTAAQEALANTPKLADVKAEDFETVFYPGGNGPMYQNAATEGGTATKWGNKLQCCKTLAAERWQSG